MIRSPGYSAGNSSGPDRSASGCCCCPVPVCWITSHTAKITTRTAAVRNCFLLFLSISAKIQIKTHSSINFSAPEELYVIRNEPITSQTAFRDLSVPLM